MNQITQSMLATAFNRPSFPPTQFSFPFSLDSFFVLTVIHFNFLFARCFYCYVSLIPSLLQLFHFPFALVAPVHKIFPIIMLPMYVFVLVLTALNLHTNTHKACSLIPSGWLFSVRSFREAFGLEKLYEDIPSALLSANVKRWSEKDGRRKNSNVTAVEVNPFSYCPRHWLKRDARKEKTESIEKLFLAFLLARVFLCILAVMEAFRDDDEAFFHG
jgi:hypothetical protein